MTKKRSSFCICAERDSITEGDFDFEQNHCTCIPLLEVYFYLLTWEAAEEIRRAIKWAVESGFSADECHGSDRNGSLGLLRA